MTRFEIPLVANCFMSIIRFYEYYQEISLFPMEDFHRQWSSNWSYANDALPDWVLYQLDKNISFFLPSFPIESVCNH